MTVLVYAHLAFAAFIFIWMLASSFREGLWGNALVFFNWCLAATFAWKLWFPLLALIQSFAQTRSSTLAGFMALFSLFIPFLAAYAGLRYCTDKLSRVRVAFHPVVDRVGGMAFGLLTAFGLTFAFLYAVPLLDFGMEPWWKSVG